VKKKKQPLTPILVETLAYIQQYINLYGYAPMQKEVSEALNVPRITVAARLQRIAKKGHIEITPRTPRGIKLV